MSMPDKAEMLQAIITKDKSYDGQFIYGVITTGIFCLPSCSTKMAKPENMRFFATIQQAMQMGFRPCKRCNPESINKQQDQLIEVIRYIESHADQKITLAQLGRIINLSPSRLQKAFKQQFCISPKSYQDALRMQLFKSSIKEGESITNAIYSSGFGSSSRIYGEASRQLGMTPKTYQTGAKGQIIYYALSETQMGMLLMAATDKGICSVQLGDDKATLLAQLKAEFPRATLLISSAQDSSELEQWIKQLNLHISQNAPKPDLPLDIIGTAFQIKVWQFLMQIKPGETYTYGEVAKHINSPKAVRAVGTACGKNPVALLIPCHRVLRGDGGLGGYRWGLKRKQALLEKEGAQ